MKLKTLSNGGAQSLRRVIEVIRDHRNISRRAISEATGLSTPSITRLVNELIALEIVQVNEIHQEPGAGPGRPATSLTLNPLCGCSIGVDIGEHTIRAAIGDMGGNIQLTRQVPSLGSQGGDATFDGLVDLIRELREQFQQQSDAAIPLRGISVCVPGTVDPDSSRVVLAPNISGWNNYPLKSKLNEVFDGLSIRIENDVNASAIGESSFGRAIGKDNFVFVSFRKGIGSGIFIDGKLYRGNAGFAGETGKLAFDPEFRLASAGGLGHLETLASESPLITKSVDAGVEFQSASGEPELKDLCMAVSRGDKKAAEVFDFALSYYGAAVANIVCMLDPEMVVIGGELNTVLDFAVDKIRKRVGLLTPFDPEKIHGSTLGEQAALKGAFSQAFKDSCGSLTLGLGRSPE